MVFFKTFVVDVPANTAEKDAIRDEKELPAGGELQEIELHVPLGCQALVPVWVEVDGAHWLPTDGTQIRTDDEPTKTLLRAPEGLEIGRTRNLALAAYNEDDTYAHAIRMTVRGVHADERGAL